MCRPKASLSLTGWTVGHKAEAEGAVMDSKGSLWADFSHGVYASLVDEDLTEIGRAHV